MRISDFQVCVTFGYKELQAGVLKPTTHAGSGHFQSRPVINKNLQLNELQLSEDSAGMHMRDAQTKCNAQT